MKKKFKHRKGYQPNEHLILEKEVYPLFTNGGRTKERRAFFACSIHKGVFYKLTYRQARQIKVDPCITKSYKTYDADQVKEYSYHKERHAIAKIHKAQHPSWFRVTRHDLRVNGELFYEFECKTDRKAAQEIEKVIWNTKNLIRKEIMLARFSFEMDELHQNGEINFSCPFWARGAGPKFFKEYLNE